METESAVALMHSAIIKKGDRKISYWTLKNITFTFTTTNWQYNCGMVLIWVVLIRSYYVWHDFGVPRELCYSVQKSILYAQKILLIFDNLTIKFYMCKDNVYEQKNDFFVILRVDFYECQNSDI